MKCTLLINLIASLARQVLLLAQHVLQDLFAGLQVCQGRSEANRQPDIEMMMLNRAVF